MNKFIVIFLVAVLTSINLFGSSFMNHSDGSCILATSQAADCPVQTAPLAFMSFHADVLQQLSQTSVLDFSLDLLMAVTILILAFLMLQRSQIALLKNRVQKLGFSYRHPPPITFAQKVIRWLKITENRDNNLVAALV